MTRDPQGPLATHHATASCINRRANPPILRGLFALAASLAATLAAPLAGAADESFVTFESGQVRPLAISPSGERLFATNTPDNRLEIFAITPAGLEHEHSVVVGMEPVAVAAPSDDEVWVVNHLSDSVSVVNLANPQHPRVEKTLLVGDEPRDIVFAGPEERRAFITTAHRGQNSPFPFEPLETQGRADVWVFDADAAGEQPLTIVTLFGDTPRPLAVSPDGNRVYAGILHSGNKTTAISLPAASGSPLPPFDDADGVPAPQQGLIVRYQNGAWLDAGDRDWTDQVRVSLPDYDVFEIDASAPTPVETRRFSGVGTTLFNIVVSPDGQDLYVSNLAARNFVRFEGAGERSDGETVRGHFVENRITVVRPSTGQVVPRHLNTHIDYDSFPGTPQENEASLATPLDMAWSADGATLYVTALGSDKVARIDAVSLRNGSYTPDPADHVTLPGGGPTGVVLDGTHDRLYVLTRFDNAIATVDIDSWTAVASDPLYNPEPAKVVNGRRFLYDARYTSSRGDSSCANCHVFGDVDHLSWNLGEPDGSVEENPNPPVPTNDDVLDFHPLKGPLTTQSMRGLDNQGPMHWRGDRTGGNDPESGDPLDEAAAFRAFNGAFEALLGRTELLTREEMDAFTDFVLEIAYPPTPIRALDMSLNADEAFGAELFDTLLTGRGQHCSGCHFVDREQDLFGTSRLTGQMAASGFGNQAMKVPHYRNLYTKVGFFGRVLPAPAPAVGDQIRGFGFASDGSFDTITTFLLGFGDMFASGEEGDVQRRAVMRFVLSTVGRMAPIVGQQITLTRANFQQRFARLQLLRAQADAGECDLVAKTVLGGSERGFLYGAGRYQSDRAAQVLTVRELLGLTFSQQLPVTYTCVPPGSGTRIGIDRDEDGVFDGDE